MARGTTLGELVTQLRLRAKLDGNPNFSRSIEPKMQQDLRAQQERLYDEFDWPFLKITADKILAAGQRFYDVPTTMNLERIISVDVKNGGRWTPVERGISLEQYNQYDSDSDVRLDPVQRWDVKDTGTGAQVEVWPIPVSNGAALRFSGIRKLKPLVATADIADLDDQMVVGFVAAEMLASKSDADAQLVLQSARARQQTLQGRVTKTRRNSFGLGTGGTGGDCSWRDRTPIAVYVRTP